MRETDVCAIERFLRNCRRVDQFSRIRVKRAKKRKDNKEKGRSNVLEF